MTNLEIKQMPIKDFNTLIMKLAREKQYKIIKLYCAIRIDKPYQNDQRTLI